MGLFSFLKLIFGQSKTAKTANHGTSDDYYSKFLSEEPVTHDEFYSRLENVFNYDFTVARDYPASKLGGNSEYNYDFCLMDGETVVCCVLLLNHNENKSARYKNLCEICESENVPLVHFYNFYLNKEEYIKARIEKRI